VYPSKDAQGEFTMKQRLAEIQTPLGNKLLMRGMTGNEELGRPFSYQLELLSEDESITGAAVLGKGMTVKISLADESQRCIHGLCTRFSNVGRAGRYAMYEAELRPWIWLLSHSSDCRIFQNETVPNIIKTVFRDHGFSDVEDSLTETYKPLEYVVQYCETALNFVTRLMEATGIYYFFTHEEGKHTLVLADSQTAHLPAKGCEEVPYYPPDGRHAREHDHFDDWHVEEQFRSGSYVVNDFDFKRPNADLLATSVFPRGYPSSDLELYDYPGEYIDVADGETLAKVRMQAHQACYEEISGGGNVRGLNAGNLFTLTKFKRADQNRQYLIVALRSQLEIEDYESSGNSRGSSYHASIVAVPSATDYRMPVQSEKPFVMGPQTAIVTGKETDEIWTDEYGRVKVKFHWDRHGKSDENSSCWVRVAQQWAGAGWGSIQIPRIGQEVVVEFLDGDPDRPLITGSVYNGYNKPPHELPSKASISGIKSRSTKKGGPGDGNEIRFDDAKGEEELFVHAQRNYLEVVEKDRKVEIKGHHEIKIKRAHTLEAGEKVEISAPTSITLKCGETASISIEPQMITLKLGAAMLVIDPSGVSIAPSAKVGNRPI
jgi:type VI secretion system secreted protein VgrG